MNCPVCNGNDGDAPCAYPGLEMPGCLRDDRLQREEEAALADELSKDDFGGAEDYEVTCARCGHTLMASKATPEEGDEWECLPCNDVHDRLEKQGLRIHELESKLHERDIQLNEKIDEIVHLTGKLMGAES